MCIRDRLAAKQMQKLGYTIIEQNYRSQWGEIDIIAQKDDVLIFTEVKFRKGTEKGLPAEAVNWKKQQHIIETAKAYLAEHNITDKDCRFDVAEILQEADKKYFRYTENAFLA